MVKKEINISRGKSIRISDTAYNSLKNFCEMRGYKMGQFCEMGAMDKMKDEIVQINRTLANKKAK